MVRVVVDPGSTHDGEKKKALELIQLAHECGAHAVKFQLLTKKEVDRGNTELDWKWFPELMAYGDKLGIEVFASVFNVDGIKWLKACGCKSIKYAYSQFDLIGVGDPFFDNVYMSQDVMMPKVPYTISLYCIPLYPVPYIIDWEGLFPRFDGFSSHCLGIEQDKDAIDAGAKYIEKHIKGPWESPCPDAKFAIGQEQLKELCDYATRKPSSIVKKPQQTQGLTSTPVQLD